ncbi:hypothetical protein F441_09714 [Phytophthora nicotianae CJ01A1]|uniref:Uncharacterized protein n=1 Tax=Phytophthora nicotianae CJ01A1 TaxID=1317063 RepID=W2WZ13_PHYNI|nr:hypothetical protein F441_09714 [Phytophthora nicotianae CJ01A1]
MGTPSEVKVVHQTSSGTPAGSVPATSTGSTVRAAFGRAARRGRRASVGEDCHGLQLDGGFTFLVDCIQKVCSLQSQRATSKNARTRGADVGVPRLEWDWDEGNEEVPRCGPLRGNDLWIVHIQHETVSSVTKILVKFDLSLHLLNGIAGSPVPV